MRKRPVRQLHKSLREEMRQCGNRRGRSHPCHPNQILLWQEEPVIQHRENPLLIGAGIDATTAHYSAFFRSVITLNWTALLMSGYSRPSRLNVAAATMTAFSPTLPVIRS